MTEQTSALIGSLLKGYQFVYPNYPTSRELAGNCWRKNASLNRIREIVFHKLEHPPALASKSIMGGGEGWVQKLNELAGGGRAKFWLHQSMLALLIWKYHINSLQTSATVLFLKTSNPTILNKFEGFIKLTKIELKRSPNRTGCLYAIISNKHARLKSTLKTSKSKSNLAEWNFFFLILHHY